MPSSGVSKNSNVEVSIMVSLDFFMHIKEIFEFSSNVCIELINFSHKISVKKIIRSRKKPGCFSASVICQIPWIHWILSTYMFNTTKLSTNIASRSANEFDSVNRRCRCQQGFNPNSLVSLNKIVLWVDVCVDDWTVEMSKIASNALRTELRSISWIIKTFPTKIKRVFRRLTELPRQWVNPLVHWSPPECWTLRFQLVIEMSQWLDCVCWVKFFLGKFFSNFKQVQVISGYFHYKKTNVGLW